MSGFKEPMQETNSGLLDLEVLLHIANSLKALQSEHILPTRKDPQALVSGRMKSFDNLDLRWTERSKDGIGHRSVGGDTGMQT